MRFLPPVRFPWGVLLVPMAERTAAWFCAHLLAEDPPFTREVSLLIPFREDPAFASWVVLNFRQKNGGLPTEWKVLWDWFQDQGAGLLCWDVEDQFVPPENLTPRPVELARILVDWRGEKLSEIGRIEATWEGKGKSSELQSEAGKQKPSEKGASSQLELLQGSSPADMDWLLSRIGGPALARSSWETLLEPYAGQKYCAELLRAVGLWAFCVRDGRWEWLRDLSGPVGNPLASLIPEDPADSNPKVNPAVLRENTSFAPRGPAGKPSDHQGKDQHDRACQNEPVTQGPLGSSEGVHETGIPDRSSAGFWDLELVDDSSEANGVCVLGALLPTVVARVRRLQGLETSFQLRLQEAKTEALAEFSAGAAHELNNPLAIISGRAQLLLRGESHPERRRDLATIIGQAERARAMLADLRLFARPPKPELRRVDLRELVGEILAAVREECAEREIEISFTSADGPAFCEVDPVQIRVALAAVCRNALEAIGQRGTIEIRLLQSADEVVVEIVDSGPGISPELRPKVFDPFFSGRQAGRGLGFGLCKAWRIAKTHGGSLTLQSWPGQGTLVVLKLPRQPRATDEPLRQQ